MRPNIKLYPYKAASESAKALSTALGVLRLKQEGSTWRGTRAGAKLINWGHGGDALDRFDSNIIINHPSKVRVAANKLLFFSALQDLQDDRVSFPEFTEDKEVAAGWAEDAAILARTTLTGHGGEGIVVIDRGTAIEDIVDAPLYVKYIPKKKEFRVHVFNGQVIDTTQKIKDPSREVLNWKVRNHSNGFIFVRNDIHLPEDLHEQAIAAVQALGLTFGAVDVIWNEYRRKSYVLEVNTAPGLQGTTLEAYTTAFDNFLPGE